MAEVRTTDLFDLSHTASRELLEKCEFPWLALPQIKEYILSLINTLSDDEYDAPAEDVRVSKTAKIAQGVTITGPAVIGHGTELRTGAFIRGSVLIGDGCVIGNSCEIKNSIIFDKAQIPHFNYVGDSIIGAGAHLGAGAVTSNVKSDKTPVTLHLGDDSVPTGMKKLGAMLGDSAEIGCHCVLNPGTVIGRRSNVYPLSSVRGYVPRDSIYKSADDIVKKR